MGIIIPSSGVFDYNHNVVLDNKIDGVQIVEGKSDFKEITIEKTFEIFLEEENKDAENKWKTRYTTSDEINDKIQRNSPTNTYYATIEAQIPNYVDVGSISVSLEYNFYTLDTFGGANTNKIPIVINEGLFSSQQIIGTEKFSYSDGVAKYFNAYAYCPVGMTYGDGLPYARYGYNNIIKATTEDLLEADKTSKYPEKNIKISHTFDIFHEIWDFQGINASDIAMLIVKSVKMIITAMELDTSGSKESIVGKLIGSGDIKNIFKRSESEFLSADQPYGTWTIGEITSSEQIVEKYENGRETAEITCGINFSYKDVITEERIKYTKFFNIGDVVCPFVMGNKNAIPLSSKNQDEAKNFIVANAKKKFDGEILQELTLIEDVSSSTPYTSTLLTITEKTGFVDKNAILEGTENLVFNLDMGINTIFNAEHVSVYDKNGNFIDNFFAPPREMEVFSRSGNVGIVKYKDRIENWENDREYGWYIDWQNEPTDTKVYLQSFELIL